MREPLLSRWMPGLVLSGLILLGLLAWWLFPAIQGWAAARDCFALGHTNCG